jgi:hypothetical protein
MIKFPNTCPASKFTQRKASILRIKDELKYPYTKKQQLNQQLLHLPLTLANSWDNLGLYIQHTIEEKLKRIIRLRYKKLI